MAEELDTAVPEQVSSPTFIEADLGVGGRSLIVASGIAIPNWGIDVDAGDVHRAQWIVHLRIPADKIEKVTTHVGLASIANDDTGFGIAVDKAEVVINQSTGELDLQVELALSGDSALWRYSYQVVATVVRSVNEITGTITWPKTILNPTSTSPAAVAPNLLIQLNDRKVTQGAPAPGPNSFGGEITETLTPIGVGEVVAVTSTADQVHARYRIVNPPKGRELQVTVALVDVPLPGPRAAFFIAPVRQGGDILTLTIQDPSRSNVDFKIEVGEDGPR